MGWLRGEGASDKLDNLHLIPTSHKVEEASKLLKPALHLHRYTVAPVHPPPRAPHTQTHQDKQTSFLKINNGKNDKFRCVFKVMPFSLTGGV